MVLGVDRAEIATLHDVRPVSTVVGTDLLTVVRVEPEHPWKGEQSLGVIHGDVLEGHRGEQAGHSRLVHARRRSVWRAPLHVGAVTTVLREHGEAVEFADGLVALGKRQEAERLGEGELIGGEGVGNRRGVLSALHIRPVTTGFRHDLVAVLVDTDREGVDPRGIDLIEVLLDEGLEAGQIVGPEVEALEPLVLVS